MLLSSFFTNMYELFVGPNPDYPEYRSGIFSSVGLVTLIVSIVLCGIFYYLGYIKPIFHKPVHWIITLILAIVTAFLFAYLQTRGTLTVTDSYTFRFAIFNALYAALYFFLCSILFKRFSIFAKHTPF